MTETELLALSAEMRARLLRIAEMLEEFGPHAVGLPHTRPLERKLWEMRVQGRDGIARALYTPTSGQRLAVLHIFMKKTRTTPRRAIALAISRLEHLP